MGTRSVSDYPGPTLGGPLPLELANTRYLAHNRPHDGLESVDLLTAWLGQLRPRLRIPLTDEHLLAIDEPHLTNARDLRDCIHHLADAGHSQPSTAAVNRLNRHVRANPLWTELHWDAENPTTQLRFKGDPITAALCEIATSTVELFSGPHAAAIRSCASPNCILYFVKDHARREWCSTTCGNRVRVARNYERRRQQT
ncbi:CGNR zinc finger domain-containing protein [Nocardia sp. NPDC052566]|uniref:CGNR zinc finger domain-containing protein n=1 Tax=Nocardia sp. NPDC052566 TaxID=3364330 RepID=UPI0037C9E92C